MAEQLNAAVVLAMLDDILEPITSQRMTHLPIMRSRVRRLRDHVAQYVDAPVTDHLNGSTEC